LKKDLVTLLAMAILLANAAHGAVKPAFEFAQGCLEPPFARAGRPAQIVVKVKNLGPKQMNVEAILFLPAGVTNDSPKINMTHWQKGESKTLVWNVSASSPLLGEALLELRQGSNSVGAFTFHVNWRNAIPQALGSYIPMPVRAETGRYLIGAIQCPLWNNGIRWPAIATYPDREPVLGWYDEGNPEVTDWEIKYALDHGISFFMMCWYRAKDNANQPVKPALEHWLREGLFHSRYGDQFKFAINFENGNQSFCGKTSERDLLENLLPFWIENYFSRSNYLVLDGKPVLAIYNVERFIRDLGGEKRAPAVIAKMRVACKQAGFKGIYLLGQYCWGTPPELLSQAEQVQRLGMDASWSYHWPTFTGAFGDELRPSGQQAIAAQETLWRNQPSPNLLTLSAGWDSQPWQFSLTKTQWRLTPDEYKDLCQRAKSVLDQRPCDTIENRLVLLDNWNEFGEGHYIFPTRENGFGYLDAIREVFATNAPPHVDLVPQDLGHVPYDSEYRALQRRDNKNN